MIFSKRCNTCKKQKSVKNFHHDKKNRDGYSASCGPCRNEKRRDKKLSGKIVKDLDALYLPSDASKVSKQENPRPKKEKLMEKAFCISSTVAKAYVPILDERQTILDAINEKYGATYTITVAKDRTCHINILKDGWKNTKRFRTPEELLACVL